MLNMCYCEAHYGSFYGS